MLRCTTSAYSPSAKAISTVPEPSMKKLSRSFGRPGTHSTLANAVGTLGMVVYEQGDIPAATRLFKEQIDLGRQHGLGDTGEGFTLIAASAGEFELAAGSMERTRRTRREKGPTRTERISTSRRTSAPSPPSALRLAMPHSTQHGPPGGKRPSPMRSTRSSRCCFPTNPPRRPRCNRNRHQRSASASASGKSSTCSPRATPTGRSPISSTSPRRRSRFTSPRSSPNLASTPAPPPPPSPFATASPERRLPTTTFVVFPPPPLPVRPSVEVPGAPEAQHRLPYPRNRTTGTRRRISPRQKEQHMHATKNGTCGTSSVGR